TGDPEGNMAGPWVWRLMPYLDFDFDVMLGYLGDEGGKIDTRRRALDIRRQPAFAYNSIFVGGWWYGPREYWYKNAKRLDTDERISVVSRTQGSIRNPSRLVTCTSAASRTPGVQKYNAVRDDFDGTYSVLPPIMGRHRVWGLADDPNYAAASDVIQLQAVDWFTEFEESGCPFAIPIGRSNAKASVLFADGHADDRFTSTLTDMRHWADAADGRNFMFDR
ncbi:MAG: hypothetical protein GY715_03020, partial [Planctomycetes bacterium]|nr:hypothetical protein [Planctomycetota bacterium]